MFTYSLQGLELSAGATGPVEVEESATTARSAVYQVLGAFFSADPEVCLDKARDGQWAKELAGAAVLLPFALPGGEPQVPASTEAGGYAAEHRRTLGGTALLGGARGDRDAEIAAVRREYEYFGLAAGDGGARPADHLATELDFLQYVCFKEAASASPRLAASFRRAQRDFLARHILTWVPEMVAGARAGAPGEPLAWALDLLDAFVAADHEYVAGLTGA